MIATISLFDGQIGNRNGTTLLYDWNINQFRTKYHVLSDLLSDLEPYHTMAKQISFENPYCVVVVTFTFPLKQVFYYVHGRLYDKKAMYSEMNILPIIEYLLHGKKIDDLWLQQCFPDEKFYQIMGVKLK